MTLFLIGQIGFTVEIVIISILLTKLIRSRFRAMPTFLSVLFMQIGTDFLVMLYIDDIILIRVLAKTAIVFVWLLFVSTDSVKVKCFFIFVHTLIRLVGEILCYIICNSIYKDVRFVVGRSSVEEMVLVLFFGITYLFLYITYLLTKQEIGRSIKCNGIVFLLTHYISQIAVLYSVYDFRYDDMSNRGVAYMVVCICVTVISYYVVYSVMMKEVIHASQMRELDKFKIKRELEQDYYLLATQRIEDIRKIKHDISNQLQVAIALFEGDDEGKAQAVDLVVSLDKSIKQNTVKIYSENIVLNTLLALKIDYAKQRDIKVTVNCKSQLAMIEELDIVSLLLNLFDNSIEACENDSRNEKQIEIAIYEKAKYYVIRFKNTYDTKRLDKAEKHLFTSKKDKDNHGYGISIVKEIARKYHGYATLCPKEELFVATVFLENTK